MDRELSAETCHMRVVSCVASGILVVGVVSGVAGAQNPAPAQQPAQPMSFFITSSGKGDGGSIGDRGSTGPDVARVSERRGRRWSPDPCARPDRHWAVAQCKGRNDRGE